MSEERTEEPKIVDYFCMPRPLWRCVRRLLPKPKPHPLGSRLLADKQAIVNGIW